MKSLVKMMLGTVATMAMVGTANAQDLFIDIGFDEMKTSSPAKFENEIKHRMVKVDRGAVDTLFDKSAPADEVYLSLFPGSQITLEKTGFDRNMGEGIRVWSGKVKGFQDGSATLVYDAGRLIGHVQYGNEVYRITPSKGGLYTISELQMDFLPEESEPFPVPSEFKEPVTLKKTMMDDGASEKASTGPGRVRVLIMFTRNAQSQATDAGINIRDEAVLALSMANTALINSRLLAYRFQWAAFRGTYCAYDDPSSTSAVLGEIQDPTTCIGDRAAIKGAEFQSDMVAVIKGTGGCGTAYYTANGVPLSFAFSVTARPCIGQHTFTHELGHNLGLQHDRYVVDGDTQETFNYGQARPDLASPIRSIMAYNNECSDSGTFCTRVPLFTNMTPAGLWNGDRLGRGLFQTDSAMTRETIIANWSGMVSNR